MHPTVPLFAVVVYIGAYYGLACTALGRIREVDPQYYLYLGARPGLGMSRSLAVGKLMLDRGIPKKWYSQRLSFGIRLARVMLYLSPIVLIIGVGLYLRAA